MTQKSRSKENQFLLSIKSERVILYRQMHRVRSAHAPEKLSSLTIYDPWNHNTIFCTAILPAQSHYYSRFGSHDSLSAPMIVTTFTTRGSDTLNTSTSIAYTSC